MAIAIDEIEEMTLPNYTGLGNAIDGLTAKQAALVLSTRKISQAELEEIVIQNDLLSKYGAKELIATGLLSANSSLLSSEKAVNAELLKETILQSSLNKEKAETFIQTKLITATNGEDAISTVILNKALMDEAVQRGVLSTEKAAEILSTNGVVTADTAEIASKRGLATAIGSVITVNAGLIASTVGIAALATVLYQCSKAVKELHKKAQELAISFKDSSADINNYKSKLEDLYNIINDSNSSIEDVTNARKSLLQVQDELIDKFGTEKSVIDDVTKAIDGQTEALGNFTNTKWIEAKNAFNNGGFWNDVANFFAGTNNIERMLNEYGEKSIAFEWTKYASVNKLTDEMVAGLENIGIDIMVHKENTHGDNYSYRTFDSLNESISDTSGAYLTLSGNAEEIYEKLLSLQEFAYDNSLDSLYNSIETIANRYKDSIDFYKDFYNQYILYEKILTKDSSYSDTYKDIIDSYEKYITAFSSGDESRINEASKNYANILSTAMNSAIANGDSDVATYFENMYPALQSVVSEWQFNVAFNLNTDDLRVKVQSVLDALRDENDRSLSAEEILGLGAGNEQYRALVSIAHIYNMTIEEMIELLKERNLISAMDYQSLVGLFGQENVDKLEPEDVNIAYTIKNIGNITFDELQTEIQKVKDAANIHDPATFTDIFALKDSDENLNTLGQLNEQLNNIHTAYNNLTDAIDTYSSTGYITIDQFQAIVEQGAVFLDYLTLEGDQLGMNEQAMYDLAESRIFEMKAQMIQGIIDNVSKIKSEEDAANYLISTNYALKKSYDDLAESQFDTWMKSALANGLSQGTVDSVMHKADEDIKKINALVTNIDLGSIGGEASNSTSSATNSFTDLLDKELAVLDRKMEAGYADFNDYIRDRIALIEDYYRQGKLSADEYYSYLEQHYDTQLSYMDKAVNAVTRRIDKEIDGLEKQKDKIEQNYQYQIDYLNEQKTLLEDANKERQRQINLQKAQYELERAKNQRTMLVYSEDRGLHYVTDDTAIKDAQQEVEDAEFDIRIADIESSISKLEEARDTETAAIDAMIEKLEEYKEQWNDITSAYEEEQENLIAAQIFGQDWESEILNGRLDTLNQFKDDYIAIQQAMVDAAYQAAQAIANGENTSISDTSKGKTTSSKDEPEHGWEVVDESNPSKTKKFGNTNDQKAKAEAYLRAENKKRAAAIGIDVSKDDPNDPNPEWLRLFKNSNVPGFYMEKYHTGLRQGPVKQHSFDEDFKLIRRAGLGTEEVPAILKVGEAVATPEQIHNLADSIRQSALPNFLIPLSSNYPFAQSIDLIASSPTQQVVNQNITLNCPNVTNHSGVEYIQRELGHLSLRALQESRKR